MNKSSKRNERAFLQGRYIAPFLCFYNIKKTGQVFSHNDFIRYMMKKQINRQFLRWRKVNAPKASRERVTVDGSGTFERIAWCALMV